MATIKSSPIAFRFDPEVKRALGVIADREGRSKANMMEWLIRKHCEREGLGWPIEDSSLAGSQSAIHVGKPSKAAGKSQSSKAALGAKEAKSATKKSKTD